MKAALPVALGLAILLGLVAWRSRVPRDETPPAPSPAVRQANLTPASSASSPEIPEEGRIGSRVLTAKRLERWTAISKIRSGTAPCEGDALLLLEGDLKREIAERVFGIRPSTADLEATLRGMAADPEDAAALERIEALFQGDRRAFLEEVVAPAFIDSELWTRFRDDPEIHRAARVSAVDLAARARTNPREFTTLGAPGDSFSRALIPLSRDAAPAKRNPLPRLDTLPLDLASLTQVPAGQIYPAVVATPEAFVVLRVDRQRPGFAEVEIWTVPKQPYWTWLTDRARELNRTIDSPELNAQLNALDSKHWLRQVFR